MIFAAEYSKTVASLQRSQARRNPQTCLEIAQKHRFDVGPPEFISGIENSLKETKSAGLRNILMTTAADAISTRRWKGSASVVTSKRSLIETRRTTPRSRGFIIYIESKTKTHALVLLTGTATYIKAGNNTTDAKWGNLSRSHPDRPRHGAFIQRRNNFTKREAGGAGSFLRGIDAGLEKLAPLG
jgi:hypothetical protein